MARNLAGKKIALTGPRKAAEMAKLVENMGGIPLIRPAQGTVFLDDVKLLEDIKAWIATPPAWVILTTGMGLDAIAQVAEEMGAGAALLEVLQGSSIAARGYKTVGALKKRGLVPLVRDDDGSTAGLIRGLESHSFQGAEVILQLHGDPAPKLMKWLKEQGAEVREVLPYQHIAPEEAELSRLLAEITAAELDAVAFTSAPQVRNLVEYARTKGRLPELVSAFSGPVVAAAVGKITAQALREEGIERICSPEEDERMGSMMVELGRYFIRN
ncbi:uroporphyrinogen-III synthase [Paenibacillus sp. XY044]|uniref:uroporphyrinogen-III synthase n=1 Tax=Paenibacillus sp. XY044 TaxID=2026089 RepID=UPI000B99CE92|nr:uroporphyrinogen-III synthase [Paenibacillus sp. XY044]OZB93431.1 uroporphyrinogen-III synthase [Paenibacillus sp. XY044]